MRWSTANRVNTGSGMVSRTVSGTSIVWVPPAKMALNWMTAESLPVDAAGAVVERELVGGEQGFLAVLFVDPVNLLGTAGLGG